MTLLMERILAADGMRVVFQPILDLSRPAPELHALECLTRGAGDSSAAQPGVMFDYVRRKHMEPVVDRACIRASLRAAAALPGDPCLSVNVHAATLGRDPEFPAFLAAAAQQERIATPRLTIEIIEHGQYWDGVTFHDALASIRDMGACIALDDVGLGYSNLRMMLESRPDYLKIDRYFVSGAHADPRRTAVLRSVAELGDQLSARVIAEGIEEEAELEILKGLGIELIQGYLFTKPIDADGLIAGHWLDGSVRRAPRGRCTAA